MVFIKYIFNTDSPMDCAWRVKLKMRTAEQDRSRFEDIFGGIFGRAAKDNKHKHLVS